MRIGLLIAVVVATVIILSYLRGVQTKTTDISAIKTAVESEPDKLRALVIVTDEINRLNLQKLRADPGDLKAIEDTVAELQKIQYDIKKVIEANNEKKEDLVAVTKYASNAITFSNAAAASKATAVSIATRAREMAIGGNAEVAALNEKIQKEAKIAAEAYLATEADISSANRAVSFVDAAAAKAASESSAKNAMVAAEAADRAAALITSMRAIVSDESKLNDTILAIDKLEKALAQLVENTTKDSAAFQPNTSHTDVTINTNATEGLQLQVEFTNLRQKTVGMIADAKAAAGRSEVANADRFLQSAGEIFDNMVEMTEDMSLRIRNIADRKIILDKLAGDESSRLLVASRIQEFIIDADTRSTATATAARSARELYDRAVLLVANNDDKDLQTAIAELKDLSDIASDAAVEANAASISAKSSLESLNLTLAQASAGKALKLADTAAKAADRAAIVFTTVQQRVAVVNSAAEATAAALSEATLALGIIEGKITELNRDQTATLQAINEYSTETDSTVVDNLLAVRNMSTRYTSMIATIGSNVASAKTALANKNLSARRIIEETDKLIASATTLTEQMRSTLLNTRMRMNTLLALRAEAAAKQAAADQLAKDITAAHVILDDIKRIRDEAAAVQTRAAELMRNQNDTTAVTIFAEIREANQKINKNYEFATSTLSGSPDSGVLSRIQSIQSEAAKDATVIAESMKRLADRIAAVDREALDKILADSRAVVTLLTAATREATSKITFLIAEANAVSLSSDATVRSQSSATIASARDAERSNGQMITALTEASNAITARNQQTAAAAITTARSHQATVNNFLTAADANLSLLKARLELVERQRLERIAAQEKSASLIKELDVIAINIGGSMRAIEDILAFVNASKLAPTDVELTIISNEIKNRAVTAQLTFLLFQNEVAKAKAAATLADVPAVESLVKNARDLALSIASTADFIETRNTSFRQRSVAVELAATLLNNRLADLSSQLNTLESSMATLNNGLETSVSAISPLLTFT